MHFCIMWSTLHAHRFKRIDITYVFFVDIFHLDYPVDKAANGHSLLRKKDWTRKRDVYISHNIIIITSHSSFHMLEISEIGTIICLQTIPTN